MAWVACLTNQYALEMLNVLAESRQPVLHHEETNLMLLLDGRYLMRLCGDGGLRSADDWEGEGGRVVLATGR